MSAETLADAGLQSSIDGLRNAALRVKRERDLLLASLRECADYLDGIPESAAGGDDEAIRLVRNARAAIAKTWSAT